MPFQLFRASAQTRSSIVEDLALGLELAAAGHPPMLVSNAFVWSESSTEQGTLGPAPALGRRLPFHRASMGLQGGLSTVLPSGKFRAILAGLDLMVPPLALFAILNVVA